MATQEQPEQRPTSGGGASPSSPPAQQGTGSRIKHLRDTYPGGVTTFVRTVCGARRGSLPTPSPETSAIVVAAEVNHGRWIVNCPFCAGAESADRDDKRFYCCSCGNRDVGGQWLRVKWPQNYRMLETELLRRSKEQHQNWKPGQTVKDLANEHIKYGVTK